MKNQVFTLFLFVFSFFLLTNCASESTTSSSGDGAGPDPEPMVVTVPNPGKIYNNGVYVGTGDNPTKSTVYVEWTAYASSLVDYYKLILSDITDPDNIVSTREVNLLLNQLTTTGTSHYFKNAGFPESQQLKEGKNYRVRVVAYNNLNNILSYDDIVDDISYADFKAIDPPIGGDISVPELSIADADVKRTQVKLNWTASVHGQGQPVTYTITVTPPVAGNTLNGLTTTSTTITGLSPNTQYTFKVRAKTSLGQESPETDPLRPFEKTKTTKPALLTGTLAFNSLVLGNNGRATANLTWNPTQIVGSIDDDKFRVIRTESDIESDWNFITNKTANSCTLTSLSPSRYAELIFSANPPPAPPTVTGMTSSVIGNYNLKVEITDDEGTAQSNSIFFQTPFINPKSTDTPVGGSPSAPVITFGTVTSNSIAFTFGQSISNPQTNTSYKVYVSPLLDGYPVTGTVATPNTPITLTGLSPNTKYDIIVEATNLNVNPLTAKANYNSVFTTTLP